MGGYKYLLLLSSHFQLAYSILEALVSPMIYSYKSMFIVFVEETNSIFGREIIRVLISLYCSCYGFLMGLLAIQFYYRYLVAYESKLVNTMLNWKIIIWFAVPFSYAFLWFFVSYYLCHQTQQANENIRSSFLTDFDTGIDGVVFLGPYLYQKRDDGFDHIDTVSMSAVVIASLLNMSSMITIIYFGWKCYRKIGSIILSSSGLHNLQTQLFQALLVDSLIPIILMHIPVLFLYLSCLLELDVGNVTSTLSVIIALFPTISALPPMFIIKNYRVAVIKFIFCSRSAN
ncbi:unnamed protein product [Caenorhabditis angaria]|uniref:Seven TM Receptor n=1 Tax=Caenorhabditis angaria TaxID=860376 RepID=A0A9P1J328_9PELO|nr:unnamed protein product [Caenorhabditis angaria]